MLFKISNSRLNTNEAAVESSGRAIFPSNSKGAQLSFNKQILYEESSSKFVPSKCNIQVAKGDDTVIA